MKTISTVLSEMKTVCENVNKVQYESFVALLKRNQRFFFAGEGRSGLIAKTIAMRLMHSGKTVFVIGETTTPAIDKDDILIALSGSGNTGITVDIAKSAREKGAFVFLITTNESALQSDWCNGGMLIPAATKFRYSYEPKTIQPLGNQFDQAAHLILDAGIIDSLTVKDSNEVLRKNHANLE